MGKASREAIGRFLGEFKHIATGRGIYVLDRLKNRQSLAYLGLTSANRRDEILGLSVADYCRGPKPDRDKSGEIWEFGKVIRGMEVYIKLKVAQVGEEKIAKCLSFHVAERPISCPYRDNPEGKER
jgi:hypothetical protein